MNILSQIKDCYPRLSRSQKAIAKYILEHPEDACFASLKQFTETLDLTEVTIVNFAKKIGFSSFLELKKELQSYIRMCLSPNDKMYHAVGGIVDKNLTYRNYVDNELSALTYTFQNLNSNNLNQSVAMLKQASNVYIIGYDSSMPAVDFLMLRLHYLGITATKLYFFNPSQMLLSIEKADENSVFVLISFPPHKEEMINVSKVLSEKKINTIIITDQSDSDLVNDGSCVLHCFTDDLLFYNSLTIPISVINLLCTLIAIESKDDFRKTREQIVNLNQKIFLNK